MSAVLASLSAALYGTGDFLGGLATRRNGKAVPVVVVVNVVGVAVMLAAAVVTRSAVENSDIGWAIAAGGAGATGLGLFYRGLALGVMSVVATLSALLAAIVPFTWGLVTGERPSIVAWLGVAAALAAIALVSSGGRPIGITDLRSAGVIEGVVAGAGFGSFFILVANTTSSAVWVLVFAKLASAAIFAVIGLGLGLSLVPVRSARAPALAGGVFDVTANLLFLLAEREGLLSLVAVITSLYPASTLLLARLVLHERLVALQWVGVGLAVAGVTLIALG